MTAAAGEPNLYQIASGDLASWMSSLGALPLSLKDVKVFDRSTYTMGWKTIIPTNNGNVPATILIDEIFPWRPAHIFLDRGFYCKLPHIEKDGYVCIFSESTPIDPNRYVDVAKFSLRKTRNLLDREMTSADLRAEFSDEFLSYWIGFTSDLMIRSLLIPGGGTRSITIWRGKSYYLAAEHEDDIRRWLKHTRDRKPQREADKFETALFISLSRAPTPDEFPKTASDFVKLAKREGIATIAALSDAVSGRETPLVVLCGLSSADGAAIFAMELMRPAMESRGPGRRTDPVQKGFRPGHVPAKIAAIRTLGNAKVTLGKVERFDADWVHGRDVVPTIERLRRLNVVVLGCGSVGSSVAILLARSGVGEITLVDKDTLESANAGRHELGINYAGWKKTTALSHEIRSRFPHIRVVEDVPKRWEEAVRDRPGLLSGASLIVSTMASWQAEGNLSRRLVEDKVNTPVVFGWTEPFAAAGHALTVTNKTGCFACGTDRFGTPYLQVSKWTKSLLHREPACGVTFQPYGAIELSQTVSLVAEAAIGALLSSSVPETAHRIWCGQRNLVTANGGDWTNEWKEISRDRDSGGFIESRPWPKNPNCCICGGKAVG